MPGSLTSGFLWSRWLGKHSRHSRCMRNPQFCVSGKRPMPHFVCQFQHCYLINVNIFYISITKEPIATKKNAFIKTFWSTFNAFMITTHCVDKCENDCNCVMPKRVNEGVLGKIYLPILFRTAPSAPGQSHTPLPQFRWNNHADIMDMGTIFDCVWL